MRRTWTDAQFRTAVKNSISIRATLIKLGLSPWGGANYETIYSTVKRLNLNTKHWKGQGHRKGSHPKHPRKIPLKEVLIENSTYTRCHLKKRLIKENILENKCALCGQKPTWKNKPLLMVLDHISGKNDDHRIENLRLLCPNCNSQQDTFCARNLVNRGKYPKGLKLHDVKCAFCKRLVKKPTPQTYCSTRCANKAQSKKKKTPRPDRLKYLLNKNSIRKTALILKVSPTTVSRWLRKLR